MIEQIDFKIEELTLNQSLEVQRLSLTDKLLAEIDNFERQYNSFVISSANYIAGLGFNISDIINLSINREPINIIKQKISQTIIDIEVMLN